MILEVFFLMVLIHWILVGIVFLIGTFFLTPECRPESTRSPLRKEGETSRPKVSVIFAYRHEEDFEEALQSKLNQDIGELEVIAVSDRSENGSTIQFHDPRLKPLKIDRLPEGWIGKAHALYQGALAAAGDWFLFTDADVFLEPSCIRSALQAADAHRLDHLALYPRIITKNFFESSFVACFLLLFNLRFQPWAACFKVLPFYVGVGSFNLIRRSVYNAIGTHRRISYEIADDMALGKLVKQSGFHQMAFFGLKLASVQWVKGLRGIRMGLRKNILSSFHYDPLWFLGAFLGLFIFHLSCWVLVFFLEARALLYCFASLVMIFFIYLAQAFKEPKALWAYWGYPLGVLMILWVMGEAAFCALIRKGLEWRDTFYPIEELKTGHRL